MKTLLTPPPILDLAHRRDIEKAQFKTFLAALKKQLGVEAVSWDGRRGSLAEYLDWRHRQGATKSAGDEQSVVDPLVRRLLETLGYGEGDYAYNRRLPDVNERAVPDYTVFARELLPSIPVFLVESKSTSIRDLDKARGEIAGAETPLAQLRRYVLGGAVHGRAGLLCNGWRLEAWEFGAEGDVRLVRVDLQALSQAADGPGGEEVFPGPQRAALRTLWDRFSHAAFRTAQELRTAALDVAPLPAEWVEKVQKTFAATGRPKDLEYHEWSWKQRAFDVRDAPEILVTSLRGLIEQFAEDVLHQLEDALARRQGHEAARKEIEQKSKLAYHRKRVALRDLSFTVSREDFEQLVLSPLDDWCRRPRLEQKRAVIQEWVAAVADRVKLPNGSSAQQMTLDGPSQKKIPQLKNFQEAEKKKILAGLEKELDDVCSQALEDFAAERQLEEEYRVSLRAAGAYQTWVQRVSSSVLVGAPEETYRREFARQTAYVYIIRLLLVRICEDKKLFNRKLSDGGLVLWQERSEQYLDYASGRSYEYLTRMAYECAQNVYIHFYGASELFDWYRMDEKMLLRALLVLEAFNLAEIDTDIIGAVYGRYLEEGKHEQGRYYTPRPLVTHMLDMVGYRGEAVIGRRIADLACGSGSFLVEACRRRLDQFRDRNGKIPKDKLKPALDEVQRSLYGLELNPFACYLAETNLLIQVLDLIRQARDEGIILGVDRFQIYSTDSLSVDDLIAQSPEAVQLLGRDVVIPELIKARAGDFKDGFDFLVGNPPYVRADEDSPVYLAYRRRLEREPWFTAQHLKWDLYVPFVQQYCRLLSEKPGSRGCLVTIESIATAPYAEKLREFLRETTTINEVLFLKGLRLFEDAKWQDNIVFSFSSGAPQSAHVLERVVAKNVDEAGAFTLTPLDELVQIEATAERLFNLRPEARLDLSSTLPLGEICYVTKGMVLHASERLQDGEIVNVPPSYDPSRFGEELVEDLGENGKRIRHRKFDRDDLVSDTRDEIHSRMYLDSRNVLRGGIGKVQWLEHGENARSPARVSRPTFPELYDRGKIVFGTFTGVAVDDGGLGDFLIVTHSVTLAVRWSSLEGIENRSLQKPRQVLRDQGLFAPEVSQGFSDWYLCALALSEPIQKWFHANKRSMKEHVYPDDIKALPVKKLTPAEQKPFIKLEKERHRLQRELVDLEGFGFKIRGRTEVPVHALAARFRQEHPEIEHLALFQIPRSLLEVEGSLYDQDLHKIRASGADLLLRGEVVAWVGDAIAKKEEVAELFARYFRGLPGTFAGRQSLDFLPRTEEGLLSLADFLREQEDGVRRRLAGIAEIQAEIDRRAWELYRPAAG
jgi:type I restriction enzyme M protein